MKNKKSLGQNWLKNRVILDKIADLAAYGVNEETACKDSAKTEVEDKNAATCLEIGPGLGFLTSSLLKRFEKVIAVEYDNELASNLPKSFPGKNLEVINGDILEFDFSTIREKYVIAGNIPYYITSPIIEKVLAAENKPEKIVLLIQKEVAERIVDRKETVLSLFVKNWAKVEIGPIVKRSEFTPPPKVDSQILVLYPHQAKLDERVFSLIKRGFAAPRKKLVHNLTGVSSREDLTKAMREIGLDVDCRPADLNLSDWGELYIKLFNNVL